MWLFLCLILMFCANESTSVDCPPLFQRYSSAHTFCLQTNASCNILKSKVSDADIAVILKEHNSYRSRVATGKETIKPLPKSSNMMQMVWDDELAAVAQKHTDQCAYEHDCGDCRRVKNFIVGQNIYKSNIFGVEVAPEADWSKAVKLWYDEINDFDMKQLNSFKDGLGPPATGHFTQVIWANSWRVGCGYILYREDDGYAQLLTCNYGPGGNFLGEPLYLQGEPCGKCPINSCCDKTCEKQKIPVEYPGLCKMIGNNAPEYTPETGKIFSCRFNDEPDCERTVSSSGQGKWEVIRTLSESYLGIVLNGGEFSMLNFTKSFKGLKSMCFTSYYRKGPNVAEQESANEALEIFTIPSANYESKQKLQSDSVQFVEMKIGLGWNMETKFSVKFSVPPGKPAQYLELKDISVTEGKC